MSKRIDNLMERAKELEPIEDPEVSDPQEIPSFPEFCRYLMIEKRGATSDEGLIPFDPEIWRHGQKVVADYLVRKWENNEPIRLMLHKSRQHHGASTIVQAFMYWLIHFRPHRHAAVAAQEDKASQNVFGNIRRFDENLDAKWKKPLRAEKVMRERVEYAPPHNSWFLCSTAGNVNVFRSFHIHYFHGSEVDFYPNAEKFFTAVNQCFPDLHETHDSAIIKESTARCRGYFYEECKAAWEHKNEYDFIFLSWKDEPLCRLPLEPGEKLVLSPDLMEYQRAYELDDEQMKWAVYKINNKCHGRLEIFNQEFPVESKLAFAYSGHPVFKADVIARAIEIAPNPVFVGDIEWASHDRHTVELKHYDHGPLKIWRHPEPGKNYLLSHDTGHGVHADFTEVNILEYGDPRVQVALWRSNSISPADSAVVGFRLGAYYGFPMAVVENNGLAEATIHVYLEGHIGFPQTSGGYPWLYFQVRRDRRTKEQTKRPGFHTGQGSKESLIVTFADDFDSGRILIFSRVSLDQMAGFAWDPHARKYVENHKDPESLLLNDDSIMSLGIGNYVMTGEGKLGRNTTKSAIGTIPLADH